MYYFSENLNNKIFFKFDKKLIEDKIWASLPKSAKSVFPVIGVHCDERGIAFPSEETIAILSGHTSKTVRDGIKALEDMPGFEVNFYITKRGRRAKSYKISLPPVGEKGRIIPFHKDIVIGGNWLFLNPSAKALYLTMRRFSFFDMEEYLSEEDLDSQDFYEIFPNRKYECCEAERDILAEHAGITIRTMRNALTSLVDNHLIEPAVFSRHAWKVFLRPPKYFKRGFLNDLMRKRYGNGEG